MSLIQLAERLFVYQGVVNVGILCAGDRALLIDCGDVGVGAALAELGVARVDRVLITHHHRDQLQALAGGSDGLAQVRGAQVGVPDAEQDCFARVEDYWLDPASRWHLYDFRPHSLALAASIPIHETYRGGDRIEWGGATISVLSTPGHTDGSLSYQVDLAGERYTFCGDLIYDRGQIWELYSLQKGWETRDYHGFLGDRKRLCESMRQVESGKPLALIPSHGNIIREPAQAIDLLCDRLAACYESYAAISALRYYFPGMFARFRDRDAESPDGQIRWPAGWMPVREGKPVPDFLRHAGTTWVVQSADGAAFALDCGDAGVVRQLQSWQRAGELGTIEWLWITHYHDDHVDAIPQFREAFACPVVADRHVAQVVNDPLAWRLPCISPAAVHVDRVTAHGESWAWHEFTVTAFHLPGQTLYHGGLLVEGRGHRILFAGDSFTMAGIDDYCAGNRNFLGLEVGFDACVRLIQEIGPDIILNSHVDLGFDFSEQECALMRANLAERERLYADLFPWDHPNYGMDESWVRCHPYEQRVVPGNQVTLDVVFTNHSRVARDAACRLLFPTSWRVELAAAQATVAPGAEGAVRFVFAVPRDVPVGRWVVPVDVTYGGRWLGPFREAIVVS